MKMKNEGFWSGLIQGVAPSLRNKFLQRQRDRAEAEQKRIARGERQAALTDAEIKLKRLGYSDEETETILSLISATPNLQYIFTRKRFDDVNMLSLLSAAYNTNKISEIKVSAMLNLKDLSYDQLLYMVYAESNGVDYRHLLDNLKQPMELEEMRKTLQNILENPETVSKIDKNNKPSQETQKLIDQLDNQGYDIRNLYLIVNKDGSFDNILAAGVLVAQGLGVSNDDMLDILKLKKETKLTDFDIIARLDNTTQEKAKLSAAEFCYGAFGKVGIPTLQDLLGMTAQEMQNKIQKALETKEKEQKSDDQKEFDKQVEQDKQKSQDTKTPEETQKDMERMAKNIG